MIEQLYQMYYKELTLWCMSMSGDPSLAEDLVQEAFLKALKNAETLEKLKIYQCRSWLYKTVRNLYVDRIRHTVRETVTGELPEQGRMASGYEEADQEQLLGLLPEEERVLFVMRYLQGYNSTELGEFFGLSPASVRTKLASARKHLKKALEGLL